MTRGRGAGTPRRAASDGRSAVSNGLANGGARRKPRRGGVLVALLALIAGACVFAYPLVSDAFFQAAQGNVLSLQQDAVDDSDEATLEAERQRAIEYNQKLLNSRTVVTDPFDPNAQRVTDEEYESVLNLAGDGVMGTITIPKIKVELPIYHGTSDDVLERGVGHLQETSVPIGGESTHAVLSGHTGLPSAKIFDNLDQLEVGDYFVITVLGEDHAYHVTSTEVVLPDETDSLVIQPGRDLCTLVTCTPYGINTHRLLVHAERCELPEEWLDKGDSAFPAGYSNPPDKALLPSVLIGLALALAVIGGYAAVSKIRKRRAARRAAGQRAMAPAAGRRTSVRRGAPAPGARAPRGAAPTRDARAPNGGTAGSAAPDPGSQPTGVVPMPQRQAPQVAPARPSRPGYARPAAGAGSRPYADGASRPQRVPGAQDARSSRAVNGGGAHLRPNSPSHNPKMQGGRGTAGRHFKR